MQDTESMQKLKVMKPISPSEIVWKLWWKGLVRKRKTIFHKVSKVSKQRIYKSYCSFLRIHLKTYKKSIHSNMICDAHTHRGRTDLHFRSRRTKGKLKCRPQSKAAVKSSKRTCP